MLTLDDCSVTSPARVPVAVMDCNPAANLGLSPETDIGKVISLGTSREESYPSKIKVCRTR